MAIRIPHFIHGLMLASADKKHMMVLVNNLVADIEKLRAANMALCQKLDAAGATVTGLGTNYNATIAIQPGTMNVLP